MGIKPVRETDIVRDFLQYLNVVRGWMAWRNNTGAMKAENNGRKRFIRFGVAGGSDIFFIVVPSGRFGCVEVKRPGQKATVTVLQRAWLEAVRSAGGIAILASSVQELQDQLTELGL